MSSHPVPPSHSAEMEEENAKAPTEAEVESVDCFLRIVVERACEDDRAADDVLVELHSGVHGFGVRSREDLVANLVAIMRRRHKFIAHAARTYAAEGPWDEETWKEWYSSRPLSEWLMEEAVQMWKRDFEAIDLINKVEVAALRAENTRLSEKQANEKVNDAWEFELAKSCGRFQLALELFKQPLAAVHTLLESWQQYITSSEHRSQKARAKRHWPEEFTQEISEEKDQQSELKLRLFRLRNL